MSKKKKEVIPQKHPLLHKLEHRLEELILALIVFLNILDFFHFVPGDVEYIQKITSWSALGYLLYKIDLADIFFGRKEHQTLGSVLFGVKNKQVDIIIILSYFLLIVKSMIGFARSAAEEAYYFKDFLEFLVEYKVMINTVSFYAGGLILLALSIYLALRYPIKKPSVLQILHQDGGVPKTISRFLWRFTTIFLSLIAFYVIVFNLMLEWLAMAVDTPLLMLAIFFYLFIVVRYHKHFSAENIIYKLGSVGESFYEEFIQLFQKRRTVFLGLSGMLVLHLLTEVGIFIIPYIIGIRDDLYFSQLGTGHEYLYLHLQRDLAVSSTQTSMLLLWVFVFNILAMLFLLFLPAYLWYKLYEGRGIRVPNFLVALFYASVAVYVFAPMIVLKKLSGEVLRGVDFMTQNALSGNVVLSVTSSIILGILVYTAARKSHFLKEKLLLLATIMVDLFFAYYIYLFASSLIEYYSYTVIQLFSQGHYFIPFFLALFMLITAVFYTGGYLAFLIQNKKEFKYVK